MNMPNYVKKAINLIQQNNKEAYIVGGCVRDSLLGMTPYDFDITTNMLPHELKEVFSSYKIIDRNGEKHGTVTVVIDDSILEITTYRKDSFYIDGRHPSNVEFVSSLENDLKRRDFTINALAYNDEEGIIDLVNGIEDLKNKKIRCVGKAVDRFNEDYLRILRALRFSSKLGFEIDEEASSAIHLLKDKLMLISKERIKKELEGILVGFNVFNVLMEYRDVFGVIIPEMVKCFDFDQMTKYHKCDLYSHICYVVSYTKPDFITRVSALFHDIGKPLSFTEDTSDGHIRRHFHGHGEIGGKITSEILDRLHFSNEEKKQIIYLVINHDIALSDNVITIKHVLNKLPNLSLDLFDRLLDLKKADRKNHVLFNEPVDLEKVRLIAKELIENHECLTLKDLKVNGDDLIKLGIVEKNIKHVLNYLLDLVLDEKVENEKKALLDKVGK